MWALKFLGKENTALRICLCFLPLRKFNSERGVFGYFLTRQQKVT